MNNLKQTKLNKKFTDTYLWSMSDAYEKSLVDSIMKSDRIDKDADSFKDIKYNVKMRQSTSTLYRVLESDNVVLLYSEQVIHKAFQVFCAKDIKTDGRVKVFINCGNIFKKIDGNWRCNAIDTFVAHLINAMFNYIYYSNPTKFTMNGSLNQFGASAFSNLVSNIMNYLFKLDIVSIKRDKCKYLAATYYLHSIVGKDLDGTTCKGLAKRISGLSDREIEIINMSISKDSAYINLKTFIQTMSDVIKVDIDVETFIDKWIRLYGTGTHFATEYFPSFSAMMTDAYTGAFINNQSSIEKICGSDMVGYSKTLFSICQGADF